MSEVQTTTGSELDPVSASRTLLIALHSAGVGFTYHDSDGRILSQHFPEPSAALKDVMAEPSLASRRAGVLQTGVPDHFEIRIPADGNNRVFELRLEADRFDGGEIAGIVTTATDITELARREQTLKTLLRELSHRSKNLLAIIQSVANQTGRYASDIDIFLERFRGRVQSLASSQDLVTSSNWRGARLHELLLGQAARYCDDPAQVFELTGENPRLDPNAALHIGLALHELTVNSVSYGALSHPSGRIGLSCVKAPHDGSTLFLTWRERTPQPIDRPRGKRFGSVALERVVPASISGSATLHTDGCDLVYRLEIPATNLSAD